jgi:TetR/AcrR family transcriptional regulator, cholesterol catabolism regulator
MADKKGWSNRDLIIAEASMLFWKKGYTETSMKDISRACGFRPANIYNFFACKESILYEILHEEMTEILLPIKYLEDDASVHPSLALRLVIENLLKLTLSAKRVSKLLFDVGLKNLSPAHQKSIIKLRDDFDRIAIAIIRRGKKAGTFADVDEKLAVFSIASMIVRARLWYSPKGRNTVDEIVTFIYNFTLRGLGAVQKNRRKLTVA